jgi:hypothetical protein
MMDNEKEISKLLRIWLTKNILKGATSLIKEDIQFKIADFKLVADLIAIQSKSNIIHGFEIKQRINPENISSVFWRCSSFYTNYKWLVVPKNNWEFTFNGEIDMQLDSFGIGIILLDTLNKEFEIWRNAKYTDGNFLKFLPELEEQWIAINKSVKK